MKMKWFKHSLSADDPHIHDAMSEFGINGYYVFFRILEIMAQEFDPHHPGTLSVSVSFLRSKLITKWLTTLKILRFYEDRKLYEVRLFKEKGMDMIEIKCPIFRELCNEYAKKTLKKISEQNADNVQKIYDLDKDKEGD